MTLAQWTLVGATLFGATGVILGAFGAHALKAQLGPTAIQTWQTAVLYQLVHALALLAVGIWLKQTAGADRLLGLAALAFAAGVVLFSGSLYGLTLGASRWLGPVTPLGGLAFIVGWLTLLAAALRSDSGA
jgi:uncharacterized membrane protein YgdD (TMEM256/DUF423 family)